MQEGLSPTEIIAFIYRVFSDQKNRIIVIRNWHTRKAKVEYDRLANDFQLFITTILYEPLSFRIFHDHFTLFGSLLVVRYVWLKESDFISRLYRHRKEVFINQKEFGNNQFEYHGLKDMKDASLLDFTVRRQIVRDFVWMCMEKREPFIVLELISAIQSIISLVPNGKSDVFLGALHQALQGQCLLKEVVCWDNTPYDLHPENSKI